MIDDDYITAESAEEDIGRYLKICRSCIERIEELLLLPKSPQVWEKIDTEAGELVAAVDEIGDLTTCMKNPEDNE